MAWGLFPIFLSRAGLRLGTIAVITAAYPLSWGILQLGTGALSDRLGRKPLIVAGMALQGIALLALVNVQGAGLWLATAVILGLGTALVYPTLLAAVSDVAHPSWRASAVGVYRLWRDLGYVVGALAAGAMCGSGGHSGCDRGCCAGHPGFRDRGFPQAAGDLTNAQPSRFLSTECQRP